MAEQNMQYKLMVLYMLGKVDFSLTYAHLSDFILGRGYTDYFNLQQTIAELTEAGLIHQETPKVKRRSVISPPESAWRYARTSMRGCGKTAWP